MPDFKDERELARWLEHHGVEVAEYGRGEARTLAHLFGELARGECRLAVGADGQAERFVDGAYVDVFHRLEDGRLLHLVEDRQEFKDGRRRRRQLESSIGEKMVAAEEPEAAARRALAEELGIREPLPLVYAGPAQKTVDSLSYPGLRSSYYTHCFSCWLPDSCFSAAGYSEHQADKTSHWVWEEWAETARGAVAKTTGTDT